jgi:uncharacterized protein YndB with AHSA1/START domain
VTVIRDDKVIHELELAASPAEVFEMFVDPAKLVGWIGVSADLEARPGGRFRFEVQPGQFCEGEYVLVEPPRRLIFTWGWTDPWFGLPPGSSRVEVELTELSAGTRVLLVHHQLPVEVRPLHDEGWSAFLARLRAVLAGADPGLYPQGYPRQRRRQLAAESEEP